MVIAAVEIKLYLPWVHSLKEKRMAVKSVLQKTQHHFHECGRRGSRTHR